MRVFPALAVPALLLSTLVACGSDDSTASADEKDGLQVAAGVKEQYEVLAAEVEERGGKTESGEWTVSYIVEAAEPWFENHEGHGAMFREPEAGETHHIEIIPTETATGRIVPDVPVTLEVVGADGKVVDTQELNFYYSTFFHYATNFHVPTAGTYTLRAKLGTPTFLRHGDPKDGPALAEGTTVEFEDVELTTS